MAVDTGQDLDGLPGIHSFQKPSDSLKVSVASLDVMKVVDLPVNKVKVNLRRADQSTWQSRYVSDTARRFVRQDFEIVTYSHSSNC